MRPRQNGRHFTDGIFQMHFLEWKCLDFDENFTEVCLLGSNWQLVITGSGNGLAPKSWQTSFLPEAVMSYFNDEYMHHQASMSQVMHICSSNLTIISSDNGLVPTRRQAIIWTNAGISLIGPLGTNFSDMLTKIYTFSFKKMHLKIAPAKWQPFGLNVLTYRAKKNSINTFVWISNTMSL